MAERRTGLSAEGLMVLELVDRERELIREIATLRERLAGVEADRNTLRLDKLAVADQLEAALHAITDLNCKVDELRGVSFE